MQLHEYIRIGNIFTFLLHIVVHPRISLSYVAGEILNIGQLLQFLFNLLGNAISCLQIGLKR